MFSVQGWNITAPLKTQVEVPKVKEPGKEGKKAQKRRQKREEQVNEGNVGEFWERVVEGKGGKEGAVGKDASHANAEPLGKRGKKRKREDGKGKKEAANGDSTIAKSVDAEVEVASAAVEPSITDKDASAEASSNREKKKRKKEKKARVEKPADEIVTTKSPDMKLPIQSTDMVSLLPEPKGLTPLQKSMRAKLAGARFRHLNETLYTKPSAESLAQFKEYPEMFEDYHRGFAQQTESWPENPVDGYVNAILTRGKIRVKNAARDKKHKGNKGKFGDAEAFYGVSNEVTEVAKGPKPFPRNFKGHATIADLGCGTASLSYRLQSHLKELNLTLHSFDLSKPSGPSAPLVTVADISALPLLDGSVDVAVFCLALMGTNWLDFIDEAWRILRWKGELWVAEIKSRFGRVAKSGKGRPPINSVGSLRKQDKKAKNKKKSDKPVEEGIQGSDDEEELAQRVDGVEGKEGTDVSAFVDVLRRHGFVLDAPPESPNQAVDLGNKMFVKMHFVKGTSPVRGKNAKKEESRNPNPALKIGMKGKKFAAVEDDEIDIGEEGKVLKPCLYKIR
ncbi:methyltransferase-domain-containing protein [Lophiotrema nucula]|uniref:Ribosomal RNA-processing protein 8 n=1 Tax=Lophiotrema nucula TaxID=690887 RepID=A0A6A5Z376_9PLEO|nr:methyltransferase-domain-containing protein [Lophiotrema nucula]